MYIMGDGDMKVKKEIVGEEMRSGREEKKNNEK